LLTSNYMKKIIYCALIIFIIFSVELNAEIQITDTPSMGNFNITEQNSVGKISIGKSESTGKYKIKILPKKLISESKKIIINRAKKIKIDKTEGNLYKIQINSYQLKKIIQGGDIVFPYCQFIIEDIFTRKFKESWSKLFQEINTILKAFDQRKYYIFIKGSADLSRIGNDKYFFSIKGLKIQEYLQQTPIAQTLLGNTFYYFKKIDKNVEIIYEPYFVKKDAFNNRDLTFLRANFIKSSLKLIDYPIAIIEGEILDSEKPEFRTVEIFIYETTSSLELILGDKFCLFFSCRN